MSIINVMLPTVLIGVAYSYWRFSCLLKIYYQVCRAIGDAYLKHSEFVVDPALERFRIREPIRNQPVISAQPAVYSRILQRHDQFIIFASDGLWDNLSNQEAVEIVHKYPDRVFSFSLFPFFYFIFLLLLSLPLDV